MQEPATFDLFLKSKKFTIPSKFDNLINVNQDIYQSLIKNHKYEVKSRVNESVFQYFINYWVKKEIPNFFYDNYLIDYIQLSEEFEIMKALIQIFLKNTSHKNSFFLFTNIQLKQVKISENEKLAKEISNFKQNIEIIFKKCTIYDREQYSYDKDRLFYSLKKGDFHSVEQITMKKVIQNGFIYKLNENDKTAIIYFVSDSNGCDITIPQSITCNDQEYLVKSSEESIFRSCPQIRSINFSMIKAFKFDFTLYCNSLNEITIPDDITEFNDRWCHFTPNLKTIKISKNNKNLIFYENKFLLGKSDSKSGDVFDILYFARRDIEEVIIPSFIKVISSFAFEMCSNLKQVEFQKNSQLEIINKYAFAFSSLESIKIPKHVKKLCNSSFYNCRDLRQVDFEEDSELELIDDFAFSQTLVESISIPKHVETIGQCAFCYCKCLTKVYFSDDSELKYIKFEAFNGSAIETIKIPSNVILLGSDCFMDCPVKSVEFSNDSNLMIIGKRAFSISSLISITVPSSVLIIDEEAFDRCSSLSNFEFQENSNLKIIKKSAFDNSQIKKIKIPSQVISIESFAFNACANLEKVEFTSDSKLRYINNYAFHQSSLKNIKIPSSVVRIGESAFKLSLIESIEFNENSELELIECYAFSYTPIKQFVAPSNVSILEELLFNNCTELISVDFSKSSRLLSIPEIFSMSSIETLYLPENLVELKKDWCCNTEYLNEIHISPKNKNFVLYEGQFLLGKSDTKSDTFDVLHFVNRVIKQVKIPSFVKVISSFVFNCCDHIEQIEFSDDSQLKVICNHAFNDSSLQSIRIPKSVVEIDEFSFSCCHKLQKVEFEPNSELKIIKAELFTDSSLESILIPASVTEIQPLSFAYSENLTKVEFEPNSKLTCFEPKLFSDSPIKCLSLPDSLIELKEGWCSGMAELTDIKISSNNKNFIFYENEFLLGKSDAKSDTYDILYFARRDIKKATIPSFIKVISSFAFNCCMQIKQVEFPSDSQIQKICSQAFSYSSLEFILIPKNVTDIGESAFEGSSLRKIVFEPGSKLKEISENLISDTKLVYIKIPQNVKRIRYDGLQCEHLKRVEFEENSNLTIIDSCAFNCNAHKINIPSSVLRIEDSGFENCKTKKIEFEEDSKLYYMGKSAFKYSDISSIVVPSGLHFISKETFASCSNLKIMEIKEDTHMREYIYRPNINFDSIMIPASLRGSFKVAESDPF